jgi:hypothetical protein
MPTASVVSCSCGTVLSQAGHRVEALSPNPICLCRFTRHIRKVHRVPALGTDPFGWLAAALDIATRRGAEVLLPVRFIDINPRLVEPVNALLSGTDLAGTLVEVAKWGSAASQPAGTPDLHTHQLLLAILGAAQHGGGRRDVLLPGLDPFTALPVAAAVLATLIRPAAWHHFTAGATAAYALSPAAWQQLQHAQVS